jgi:hypothetical protein
MTRVRLPSLVGDVCRLLAGTLVVLGCTLASPGPTPHARAEPPEPSLAGEHPSRCEQLDPCPEWNVSISGTVTDRQGRPVEGANVIVEGVGMREMPPPETDPRGRYDYADYAMEPGAMTVTVTAEGYEDSSTEVTLRPGDTRVVDHVLTPRPTGSGGG